MYEGGPVEFVRAFLFIFNFNLIFIESNRLKSFVLRASLINNDVNLTKTYI